jgi:hypothetical protein
MAEAANRMNVQVASFTTPLDAELARTLLEQHDIESRLEGDMVAGAALHLQYAMGGIKVLVADVDAERASKLIEEHERELAKQRVKTDTADARVARAYRLALVGLMLLPLVAQIISLVNIVRTPWRGLSSKGRRHYVIGLGFDLLVIGAAVWWWQDNYQFDFLSG